MKNVSVAYTTTALPVAGQTLDVQAHLAAGWAKTFGLNVRTGAGQHTLVGYDTSTGTVFVDRTRSGNVAFSSVFASRGDAASQLTRGGLDLRILVDASSMEVFGTDGQVVLTDQIFPDSSKTGVSAFATAGTIRVNDLRAWTLKSIWK